MNNELIDEIVLRLEQKNINLIYICPSNFLKYLIGVNVLNSSHLQGFILTSKKEMIYIVPELNYEEVKLSLGDIVDIYSYNSNLEETLEQIICKYELKDNITMAVDNVCSATNAIKLSNAFKANLLDGSKLLNYSTMIKNKQDIEELQEAAIIADKTIEMLLNYIKPGMIEGEVLSKMKDFVYSFDQTSEFWGMVACGKNTAFPHYNNYNGVIKEQDIVMTDFGFNYKNMSSDTTRTFFIKDATDEQRKIYNIVLKANLKAQEFVRKGIMASEIDNLARNYIKGKGYGDFFTHGLGHGLGSDIHEEPYIRENSKIIIQDNMVFSIEPGIYLPDKFGIRIEDIVVVINGKAVPLQKSSKELIIL